MDKYIKAIFIIGGIILISIHLIQAVELMDKEK